MEIYRLQSPIHNQQAEQNLPRPREKKEDFGGSTLSCLLTVLIFLNSNVAWDKNNIGIFVGFNVFVKKITSGPVHVADIKLANNFWGAIILSKLSILLLKWGSFTYSDLKDNFLYAKGTIYSNFEQLHTKAQDDKQNDA